MPGITISAGYGAGGYRVAHAVSDRLGLLLLDRAISSEIARKLRVTVEEADDATVRRSFTERFFAALAPMAGGVIGTDADHLVDTGVEATPDSTLFRRHAEEIIRRALPGGAVVLGRAGAAMLADDTDVLRVRLFGSVDARVRQAAEAEGFSLPTAAERLAEVDRARAIYVKRLYNRDIADPALYHLQLDSTALPLSACAQLIVSAYEAFRGRSGHSRTT